MSPEGEKGYAKEKLERENEKIEGAKRETGRQRLRERGILEALFHSKRHKQSQAFWYSTRSSPVFVCVRVCVCV